MSSYSQSQRRGNRERPKASYTGPPRPPPPPPQPTESYLKFVDSPPLAPIPVGNQPRKLLVLSTNGTILSRVAKAIRLRPYMGSFRKYLMHPDTRAWLDVMVWSSAMPQNVDLMMRAAFPNEGSRLLAVWARDKMDLSAIAYRKQESILRIVPEAFVAELEGTVIPTDKDPPTYKDLAKLWIGGELPSNYTHSAHTTILVDEDPQKASKQPYNVLSILDYTDEKRKQDREIAIKSLAGQTPDDGEKIDDMLLAVIGVLDAMQGEENVAGWIKDDGIWRPAEARTKIFLRTIKRNKDLSDAKKSLPHRDPKAKVGTAEMKGGVEQPNTKNNSGKAGGDATLVADAKPTEDKAQEKGKGKEKEVKKEEEEEEEKEEKEETKNQREEGNQKVVTEKQTSTTPKPEIPLQEKLARSVDKGKGKANPDDAKTLRAQAETPLDKTKPWFENPAMLSAWCDLGKAALTRMDIIAEHGINV